jgi:hypothetical protein
MRGISMLAIPSAGHITALTAGASAAAGGPQASSIRTRQDPGSRSSGRNKPDVPSKRPSARAALLGSIPSLHLESWTRALGAGGPRNEGYGR